MNSSGTVIGKGICIQGEITGSEDVFLDGMVEGNLSLDNKRLTIGPNGLAQADIVTGDLVVFGRVEGSVHASARAELKRGAAFTGDLVASRLSIEDSAAMHGFVDLTQDMASKKKADAEPSVESFEEPGDLESVEPQYSHAI